MGCKSSNARDIIVSFNGSKRQMTGKEPSFDYLNEWIYSQYVELRGHALVLKVNSIPLKSQSEFSIIAATSETIQIQIEKNTSNIVTSLGIGKVMNASGKTISTGFLINKTYFLLPSSAFNFSEDLIIMFPNGSERRVRNREESIEITRHFKAVRLDKEITDIEPILLQPNTFLEIETSGTIFFYTIKLPILQKYTGKFLLITQNTIQIDVILDEGTAGSPILNSHNQLLGVYSDTNSGVPVNLLCTDLDTKKNEINVKNLLNAVPDILIDSFPNTTCFLDNTKLIYYNADETVNKSISLPESTLGCSAIVSCYGIIITGFSSENGSQVRLFNGTSFNSLPSLKHSHFQHCIANLFEDIYVISGSTNIVEMFNFKSNTWTNVASLSKKRSLANAVTVNGVIYVIGGRRDEKILRSIVMYKQAAWEKIIVEMPIGLMLVGCLAFSDSLLIFGGESSNGKNKQSWSLQFLSEIVKEDTLNVGYNFGRFPVCYYDDEVLFFTNDGVLLRFDHVTNRVLTMCLDEENVLLTCE